MIRRTLAVAAAATLILLGAASARAWHEIEHGGITAAAAELLRQPRHVKHPVPSFFLEGLPEDAAQVSVDPDVFKVPALEALRHAEYPEHFVDLEHLGDANLPALRYDYYRWCYHRGLDPARIGTLPYAVTEWTQRLTTAFAEHRARPRDRRIRRKCLVYAGLLAHYAADACQPLHTTVHYDGRVNAVGDESPRTGIHKNVDSLLRRIDGAFVDRIRGERAVALADVFAAVIAEIHASHALVDRVYELEEALRREANPISDPQLKAFAIDRLRASVRFTASLYRTAWAKSAALQPPHWLNRDDLTRKAGAK